MHINSFKSLFFRIFMTKESDRAFAIFQRIGRYPKNGFSRDCDLLRYIERDGVKVFKRRALGVCGWPKIFNGHDFFRLLLDLQLAKSVNELPYVTGVIVGIDLQYEFRKGEARYLRIDRCEDLSGINYLVHAGKFKYAA